MIYHDFNGLQLSSIGMGCMRLPTTGSYDGFIDVARVEEMVDYALSQGLNYFDTAWGYHSGRSEAVIGACLKRHPRDRYHLATKFPGYNVDNFARKEEIFEEQINKTQSECFDFYLLHNVIELNIEQYLDTSSQGLVPYLLRQKERGLIKHLGFSCHGEFETLVRLVETWGGEMEFAQIQLNYQDWHFQHASRKVKWLNERNIPIVAMEPLRGGHLARFSPEEQAKLDALRPDISPIEWGYRYVQSTPGVIMTLSGMSNLEQCKQNLGIFQSEKPLTATERTTLEEIAKARTAKQAIPCTGCRYCLDECPNELNIPYLISLYNEYRSKDDEKWLSELKIDALPEEELPSMCVGCGSCTRVCPQRIEVASVFDDFIDLLSR